MAIENLTSAPATHIDTKDESLSPALPTPSTSQSEKSGDPSLLSPVILESDLCRSSADEDEHQPMPPSPALSAQSSSHSTTSAALREHKRGGIVDSLALLSPRDNPRSRSQRPPNATTTDDATVNHPSHPASSHAIASVTSAAHTLNTPAPIHTSSAVDSVGSEEREHEDQTGLDLIQDEPIDPTPFVFKPHLLASLVDPKNLESLEAMGGTEGLLAGLGTDPTNGLMISGKESEPSDAPTTVVATSASEEFTHRGAAYNGTVEDRRRVYGSDVPPVRKSKSLSELMWFALKDKVLVSLCHFRSPLNLLLTPVPPQALLPIAAVISLTLGFFHDHNQGQGLGKPPVDWVEGVAIVVAIFIVVCALSLSQFFARSPLFPQVIVDSLNDWHEEMQSRILNDKEERHVKVIRSGVEHVIDAKELLVGDIALLEPGEIVPCDGVFISGHNVKCDESGATGKSDVIRKVGYDKFHRFREQARREGASTHGFNVPNTRTDCFVVSGSKILDGHGKYVVIAVGQRSFNGRAMMGMFIRRFSTDLWTLTPPHILQLSEETPIPSLCRTSRKILPSSSKSVVVPC